MLLKELSALASPLSQGQVEKLKQFTAELNPIQQAWVSGYLAASANAVGAVASAPAAQASQIITILYGSQTGNGRGVAETLAQKAQEQGYSVNLTSMADYKARALKQETLLLVVVSTHGEGEAPDDAMQLHEFLASKRAPKLDNLHYSVLALGDSSYEFFCQTGKDFDARLAALGAKALTPIVECDVDYEESADAWTDSVLEAVKPHLESSTNAASASVVPISAAQAGASQYTKKAPYTAEILVSQKLTGRDSDRDVRHVEIDLGESGIEYQVGDALGVWFSNNLELVDEVLAQLELSGDESVEVSKQSTTLKQALVDSKELTQLYPGFIQNWAELSGDKSLQALASDKSKTREFMLTQQVVDIIKAYPAKVEAQAFVDLLRPLTPRLYSIASSQAEVEAEVHLTVALVEDERNGQARFGGASHFLASAEEGQEVKVYVEPNNNFRLPESPDTPVIMIGPGTGVAPFRAFMQQRSSDGVEGNSWLFFGNPHFEQDFLYQTEWQQYLKSGELTQLDVAFSRDQEHKIYVQHRISEQAEQVWQWLQNGAHIYICGDAERMAKDVHQALLDVAQTQGGLSSEDAASYLDTLRVEKRYQKDVY
ncbi:assimilatory sulfite reductase (NADPH) flavoprotein subunit [Shewanella sp. WXL01]|uniref:assimilatory sulfite reductase (NADPH) flavoprotein subunit n=1 Tax=Shewanella sp. WXL01 TaxID=2709721 RepID=UPI0014383BC7|nr:assimilatory sulfite reductase (NADPH) flavoprotein subunit [Shewanella sp. WXL01]NKF50741.1 assimilatory sulfite reductase (NADPH) flavoprotein subunit [Shewanella sp. WXL01]